MKQLLVCVLLCLPVSARDPAGEGDRYDHFNNRVLPLLQARCISCHGPDKQKGGLRLDSRAALLKGGETGPALDLQNPEASLLLQAVRHAQGDLKMPPKEKLTAEEIGALGRWIREGATWPDPANVLFEDDEISAEGEGTSRLSTDDRYAGSSALLVTTQRSCPSVPGWSFRVAEHPKAGEVRYARFAWKKRGGGAIFFELANRGKWRSQTETNLAWVAGPNTTGWGALSVAPEAPSGWSVVTRDLWKDRGSWADLVVTGFCLTAVDGGEALVDSVILGPTIESLDAYRPNRVVPSGATRLGDAWSDPRNPIVRIFQGKRLDLWSLRKIVPPQASTIDELVQASLAKAGLSLSPQADLRTLIRRVTVDLTGLPPTPEELEETDYAKVVDRLLASPRYGERWARHWMDVVRYADTQGFERDELQPLLWRYRDYLIRSFNSDKPYDEFIREQIAGDELVPGAPKDARDVDRLIATGYLRLGPYDSTGSIFEENAKNRNELMTDLANTTGSAFLGLTIACANCHDHKFDPVSQADHFRLRAFFAGVKRQDDTAIDLAPVQDEIRAHNAGIDAQVKELEKQVSEILEPVRKAILEKRRAEIPAEILPLLDLEKEKQTKEIKEKIKPFADKLKLDEKELVKALPEADRKRQEALLKEIEKAKAGRRETTKAMTMREAGGKPPATHLFYQGDFTQPREEISAGFLSALDPNPAADGHRSTLASWIVSPKNPLTARVIVNRVWQHHFGRGIVATPNDFGFSGVRPTHPELLDWLASEFVAKGWSLKTLHRMILLSATYRQTSKENAEGKRVDPDNRLFWRQNLRRMDAEATRDAMLVVSGLLLPKDSGEPVWPPVPQDMLDAQPGILETKSDKAAKDRLQGWFTDPVEKADVRSIFLIQKRALGVPFLQPFDLPDMNVSCGRRDCTTVAPQALQLLNSAFAERTALAFAKRVEKEAGEDGRVERALRLALGRGATAAEVRLGRSVVERRGALVDWCRVLLNVNEFVYLD
jgi:hypothetical protein